MKKKLNKICKWTLATIAMCGSLYLASPKIWSLQYNINKQIKENLEDCSQQILFSHEDKTTTDILDFMSGNIAKNQLYDLLVDHGYQQDSLKNIIMREDDEAMHNAIREMHEKLGNPKVKFKWDYKNYINIFWNKFLPESRHLEVWQNERARYNFNTNTILIYNLDSSHANINLTTYRGQEERYALDQKDGRLPLLENDADFQRMMVNNRVAELSHAYQNKKQGFIKLQIDIAKDFVVCKGDYSQTYNYKDMVEYEAHEIYEPVIIKNFINRYLKYADIDDPDVAYKIARFYSGYFENYRDYELSQKWLQKAALSWNVLSCYILANRALKKFEESYNDYFVNQENAKCYFDEAIDRYITWYKSWSRLAADKLIHTCRQHNRNIDVAIWICQDLINTWNIEIETPNDLSILISNLIDLYNIKYADKQEQDDSSPIETSSIRSTYKKKNKNNLSFAHEQFYDNQIWWIIKNNEEK